MSTATDHIDKISEILSQPATNLPGDRTPADEAWDLLLEIGIDEEATDALDPGGRGTVAVFADGSAIQSHDTGEVVALDADAVEAMRS